MILWLVLAQLFQIASVTCGKVAVVMFFCYSRWVKKLNLKSVVWREGKHYVAQCLNVEVSSFGVSKKEALANLNEAITLYFEDEKSPEIMEVNRAEVVTLAPVYA